MKGHVYRVATRFEQVAKPGFIRICCGAHQIDIVLQEVFFHFGNEKFYQNPTAAISYLCWQQNLIADMRSRAPKVSNTRWESMSHVSSWFKAYKIHIADYFEVKKSSCIPSPRWWAEIMIIDSFANRTNTTFKQLQGHSVTVSIQHSRLVDLQAFYLSAVGEKSPLLESEANHLDSEHWMLSRCGRCAGSYAKLRILLINQGFFCYWKDWTNARRQRQFPNQGRDSTVCRSLRWNQSNCC